MPALGARHGLPITGVHLHIGSGTDLEHLSQVCGAMERLPAADRPFDHDHQAGGGLPIAYRPATIVDLDVYFRLWDAAASDWPKRLAIRSAWRSSPAATWWPRAVTWSARSAPSSRWAQTFYLLDAGFNNLARPILYGAVSSDVDCD